MAASDAKPIPRKNAAYRVTFPLFDADGDLVSGATGLDSEVSIDGAAFGDCTNEATEIAASSGIYYLDLTAAEMNGDTIAIIVKTSTVGAKTTPIILYPEEAGDIRVNITQISDANVNTAAAQLGINVVSVANDAITAAAIAPDAIGSSELAASAVAEIQSGLSVLDAAGVRSAVGLALANLDTQLTTIDDFLDTEIAAIKVKTDALPSDPADASDIATSFGTVNTTLGTIASYIDTEVAAIKAKTDLIPAAGPASAADYTAGRAAKLDNIDAAMSTRATPAQVNAEVVDALAGDTYAEPGGVPAATSSLKDKISWLFLLARNKRMTTSAADAVRNDGDTATVASAVLSDDGVTFARDEYA